ncbi:MAG: carbohydrate ABC transporter permease [bacterium]|nr:carbohydrate ABC transporter permease [bacterium]
MQYGFKRLILLSFISLLLLTNLFPLIWMVITSLRPEGNIISDQTRLIPEDISLDNFRDVWQSGPFARYTFNSVLVTGVVILTNLIFSSMVGYAFARSRFRGKQILFGLIVASLMIPKQVLIIPVFILMHKVGLINTYLALILPFCCEGFNIFLMRQYIQALPSDLEDAARLDGASEFGLLFRVVMPLARPALAVVAINTALVTWNAVLYPLILTSTDEMRTLPVGLALYSQGPHSVDWGHLMAGSSLACLPILIIFLAFQRHIIAGITAGAVKQ